MINFKKNKRNVFHINIHQFLFNNNQFCYVISFSIEIFFNELHEKQLCMILQTFFNDLVF